MILSLNWENWAFSSFFFFLSDFFFYFLHYLCYSTFHWYKNTSIFFTVPQSSTVIFLPRITSISLRHTLFSPHDMPTDINPVSFSPTNPWKRMPTAKSNKLRNYYYVWMEYLKPHFFFRTLIFRMLFPDHLPLPLHAYFSIKLTSTFNNTWTHTWSFLPYSSNNADNSEQVQCFLNSLKLFILFAALSEAFPNHHAYTPASLIQAATFVDLAQNEDGSIISLYLTLL